MPLSIFRNTTLTVTRPDESVTIPNAWQNVFNQITTTDARTLTLNSSVSFTSNSEIIVRNSSASSDAITIALAGDFTADVSADLGLIIPVGGIGQLKRIGASNVWNFYGYIEGAA